jgi:hypothetical protein
MQLLVFRFITLDSRHYAAGVTIPSRTALFRDETNVRHHISNDPDEPDSVASRLEDPIIGWLLASSARELFLAAFQFAPTSSTARSVRKPFIHDSNSKPGDIDLVICRTSIPSQITAVQAKGVKVRAISWEEDKVNRLQDLEDAVEQANRTRAIGFYKTYLLVLILCDARERRHHNIPGRKATAGTFNRIWQFPEREQLHHDVGLVFVEIVQPTKRAIHSMATVAVAVAQTATPQEQRPSLTDKVAELVASEEGRMRHG